MEVGVDTCEVLVAQLCPTLCLPMDYSLPGSSVHGVLQARILEWLPFPSPGDLLNPGIKPVSLASPALAGGFFTTEPPGKPIFNISRLIESPTSPGQNTGVGSLSLLQGIFPTQGSNPGLLHCR